MESHQERYCFLEGTNVGLALALKADDFIVAGADFKLFDPDTKMVIEEWKTTIDKGEPSIYRFKTKPLELSKKKLSWQIVCCSSKDNAYEGHVMIAVSQGNNALKPTKPLKYNITNIPPCGMDGTESFKGSMIFIHNTGEKFVD